MHPEPVKIELCKEKHIKKYRGNLDSIWMRSSWEKYFFFYLLEKDSINWVTSENVIIWYVSPLDNKSHRYFIDFSFEYITSKNNIRKAIVEVKPYLQCKPPELPKSGRKTKRYNKELDIYKVNMAKWNAAKEFALFNGLDFRILTEKPYFFRDEQGILKYDKKRSKLVDEYKLWKYEELVNG